MVTVATALATAGAGPGGRHRQAAPRAGAPGAPSAGTPPGASGGASGGAAAGAGPNRREPLQIELRDDGTSLLATWRQPSNEPAPVVVAVARDGKPATVVADLPAGTTQYTLTNVDPHAEYCVIVAAIYPGETASGATSVCTRRATPSANRLLLKRLVTPRPFGPPWR
jgi:hypothetical protein